MAQKKKTTYFSLYILEHSIWKAKFYENENIEISSININELYDNIMTEINNIFDSEIDNL